MRQILLAIVFFAVLLFIVAPVTFSQVVCVPGAFTTCLGPNGQSTTQVPFSRNQGVIITDQDTMPYTILTPTQPARSGFDPAPLPSFSTGTAPTYRTPPTGMPEPLFLPGMGDGPAVILGR